jgi:GT2 family glycosyltransferase
MARVTAVVVNWNAGGQLGRCVESLLARDEGDAPEVVVVDNASVDGSVEALGPMREQVKVVQTGRNLGFGRAVNRGVASSVGPYVAVLNPDVVLKSDSLGKMVNFLERSPDSAIVGPRLLDSRRRVLATCGLRPNLAGEVCRKFLLHLVFPFLKFRRRFPRVASPVGWVTGACFVARRSALEAIGGMDEAIFMYYEDVDLCLRLKQREWGVYHLPDAEGVHLGGHSSKQSLERMLVVSEASYAYFAEKHYGLAAAHLLSALRPFEMVLRTVLWGCVFVAVPGRRDEARTRLRAYRRILAEGVGGFLKPGDDPEGMERIA